MLSSPTLLASAPVVTCAENQKGKKGLGIKRGCGHREESAQWLSDRCSEQAGGEPISGGSRAASRHGGQGPQSPLLSLHCCLPCDPPHHHHMFPSMWQDPTKPGGAAPSRGFALSSPSPWSFQRSVALSSHGLPVFTVWRKWLPLGPVCFSSLPCLTSSESLLIAYGCLHRGPV